MKKLILGLSFFMAFAIVGKIDFESEKLAVQNYCDGVKNNYHSDYKNIYKTECKR